MQNTTDRERPRSAARRGCRLLPLASAIAWVCAAPAGAATIAVNDAGGDSVLGKCTLADAVQALNTFAAVNGCAAGDGISDTIDLGFFTSATRISFVNPNAPDGQSGVAINRVVSVHGPLGADGKPLVTIERSSASGVDFRVIATSADLTLQGVTISGGRSRGRGAGVYASGSAFLDIVDSVISGNATTGTAHVSGGGVASEYGPITLTGSTVSGNSCTQAGGGIYNLHQGSIIVQNSTVSGNHSYYAGGGIYGFNGDVTLTGSTVSGNSTYFVQTNNGVQYHVGGFYGGGIAAYRSVHLTNSTVTDNYAVGVAGGVFIAGRSYGGRPAARPRRVRPQLATAPASSVYVSGNAYLYFSTISGNRTGPQQQQNGGLVRPNYLRAIGTIISGNTYGNLNMAFPGAKFTGSNDIVGSPPIQAPADTRDCDPKLGSLGSYGGQTRTLPLLDGSCAIDTGPTEAPNGVTTDQRGLPRPAGGVNDVGAFEKQGANDPPPDIVFQDGFEGI